MGPHKRHSSTLSDSEEAAVVAFRVQTWLPLNDVYLALRPSIPALTRSTLHRSLQREGVSRLPRAPKQRRGQFAAYEIGYFHLHIAEVRTATAKAYLYVAVDRTSKRAFARLDRRATALVSAAFLKVLVKAVPYRIHTVLTDNGVQFADAARRRVNGFHHPFDRMCRLLGVEHRLTNPLRQRPRADPGTSRTTWPRTTSRSTSRRCAGARRTRRSRRSRRSGRAAPSSSADHPTTSPWDQTPTRMCHRYG
jgi:transposase-like protein